MVIYGFLAATMLRKLLLTRPLKITKTPPT
jgi:hypothetical protein